MTIAETITGENMELTVSGRLDTTTAPQLETKVKEASRMSKVLVMDLKNIEYISSAGLRVVLLGHKLMAAAGGRMAVRNPSEFCRSVFNATGMDSVLAIV